MANARQHSHEESSNFHGSLYRDNSNRASSSSETHHFGVENIRFNPTRLSPGTKSTSTSEHNPPDGQRKEDDSGSRKRFRLRLRGNTQPAATEAITTSGTDDYSDEEGDDHCDALVLRRDELL